MTSEPRRVLLSWRSIWRLCRALVVADDKLTADEAASTLFRFFRSKHVTDLRLISTLAFFIFLVHVAIVVIAAERVSTPQLGSALATFVAPAIPIYGAIMAWTYLTATSRLGVVDLFACEMRTVCRVGTAFDIGIFYVKRHDQCLQKINEGKGDTPLEEHPPSSNSKGFISQEDYFPVFANNSHDLEALEATVVGHITEFYTYMKATRDLQRKSAANEPAKIAEETYANLIFVLFLGYESARKAIKELIEFEPTRAENMMMILLTELVCYKFLCEHYQKDELRFERLALRLTGYKDDLKYIEEKVKPRDPDDKDWGPAKRTLQELTNRYNEMKLALPEKPRTLPQDNKETKSVPAGVAA